MISKFALDQKGPESYLFADKNIYVCRPLLMYSELAAYNQMQFSNWFTGAGSKKLKTRNLSLTLLAYLTHLYFAVFKKDIMGYCILGDNPTKTLTRWLNVWGFILDVFLKRWWSFCPYFNSGFQLSQITKERISGETSFQQEVWLTKLHYVKLIATLWGFM